ncbi:hypothetical protein DdX_06286 [Ditylenchus destructor]|uniref:C-type lectin domain-containing protein n=1 Tax=Ditylenchus destructor TaxID=166010 RepID=A0AAD4R9I3_9BILA|nr:hypothetical protein DdX_06286 [Ditylenchus destructor]
MLDVNNSKRIIRFWTNRTVLILQIFTDSLNFDQAKERCRELRAELVIFKTVGQYRAIKDVLQNLTTSSGNFWIEQFSDNITMAPLVGHNITGIPANLRTLLKDPSRGPVCTMLSKTSVSSKHFDHAPQLYANVDCQARLDGFICRMHANKHLRKMQVNSSSSAKSEVESAISVDNSTSFMSSMNVTNTTLTVPRPLNDSAAGNLTDENQSDDLIMDIDNQDKEAVTKEKLQKPNWAVMTEIILFIIMCTLLALIVTAILVSMCRKMCGDQAKYYFE